MDYNLTQKLPSFQSFIQQFKDITVTGPSETDTISLTRDSQQFQGRIGNYEDEYCLFCVIYEINGQVFLNHSDEDNFVYDALNGDIIQDLKVYRGKESRCLSEILFNFFESV